MWSCKSSCILGVWVGLATNLTSLWEGGSQEFLSLHLFMTVVVVGPLYLMGPQCVPQIGLKNTKYHEIHANLWWAEEEAHALWFLGLTGTVSSFSLESLPASLALHFHWLPKPTSPMASSLFLTGICFFVPTTQPECPVHPWPCYVRVPLAHSITKGFCLVPLAVTSEDRATSSTPDPLAGASCETWEMRTD